MTGNTSPTDTAQAGNDVFDSSAQAAFIKNFGSQLVGSLKATSEGVTSEQIDPLAMVDTMVDTLRQAGADEQYIQAIEALKGDPELVAEIEKFGDGLKGERDITEVGTLPRAKAEKASGPTLDPGLNGDIFLKDDAAGNLLRYSDYISGAGTTVGGFASGLPSSATSLISASWDIHDRKIIKRLAKVARLEKQLGKDMKNLNGIIEFNRSQAFDVEAAYHKRPSFTIDTIDGKHIKIDNLSPKDKAMAKAYITKCDLDQAKRGVVARSNARNLLGNVGKGVKVATTGFGIAMGGVSIKAGLDKAEDAQNQYEQGLIDKDERDYLVHKANMRTASGVMGIGKGVASIGEFVAKKVAKNMGEAAAKKASRFAPVVGNIIGIGLGIMSVTKNALAADEARRDGNHGRAAMFGVMAALDSVTVVLDGVGLVLDLIPGIGTVASFVVDLVSTVIGLVSDLIGFFTEMVDTRTAEEKLQAKFNDFVGSAEFKTHIDALATTYEKQGYDMMKYYIDTEGAGVNEEDADKNKIAEHEELRNMSQAAKDGVAKLRMAIIDNTFADATREGGEADDLIRVIGGGNKTLYGHGGNDFIFDAGGNSTLHGGDGNDFLDGGPGADKLYGGEGNDKAVFQPGIDPVADGGPGIDTLIVPGAEYYQDGLIPGDDSNNPYYYHEHGATLVSHETLNKASNIATGPTRGVNAIHAKGVYINLEERSAGFRLDSQFLVKPANLSLLLTGDQKGCFNAFYNVYSSDRDIKKQISDETTALQQLRSLFQRDGGAQTLSSYQSLLTEIQGKKLWLLARDNSDSNHQTSYFTDGEYLYDVELSQGRLEDAIIGKSRFRLQDIDNSIVNWKPASGPQWVTGLYHDSQKVEATLFLAFSSTDLVREFENIILKADTGATVIGDAQDNMILIGQEVGHDYTDHRDGDTHIDSRSGNDTIVLQRASGSFDMATDQYNTHLAIDGGEGVDTLVLASDAPQSAVVNKETTRPYTSYRYSYVLVDQNSSEMSNKYDNSFGAIQPGTKMDGNGAYYHILQVGGIESVVIEDNQLEEPTYSRPIPGGKYEYTIKHPIYFNAVDLSTNLTISVNSKNVVSARTTVQDDTLRIINAAAGSTFINSGGGDLLDFQDWQGAAAVSVDLSANVVSGALQATVQGFDNVRASRFSGDLLKGNDNDNLLVAFSGRDTLEGGKGNDHLVAGRGQHTLIGGEGADTYTVNGPVIKEKVTIRVTMGKDNQLSASGGIGEIVNGDMWVLDSDPALALANIHSFKLVNDEGKQLWAFGTYQSGADIERPFVDLSAAEFQGLEQGESMTVHLNYETIDSYARIDEADHDNLLRIGHFTAADQIRVDLDEQHNLVFKDIDGRVVLTDLEWGRKLKRGETSLLSLAADFAKRFPKMVLTEADVALDQNAIYNLLTEQLKSKMQQSRAEWDMHVVVSELTNSQGVPGGVGNDTFIADSYGDDLQKSKLIITEGGNDLIDASGGTRVGDGSNETVIGTGDGDDLVIVGNSDRMIDIYWGDEGSKILKVRNWTPEQLQVESNGNNGYLLKVDGVKVAGLNRAPDMIAFEDGDRTWFLSEASEYEVTGYLACRMRQLSFPLIKFLDKDQKLGLSFDQVQSAQTTLDISKVAKGVDIKLMNGTETLYTFSLPKLSTTLLEVNGLSLGLAMQVAGGIEFADKVLDGKGVSSLLNVMLRDTSRYSLEDGLSLDEGSSRSEVAIINASFEDIGTAVAMSGRQTGAFHYSSAYTQWSKPAPTLAGWSLTEKPQILNYMSKVITSAYDMKLARNGSTDILPQGVLHGENYLILNDAASLKQTLTEKFNASADYQLSVDLSNYKHTSFSIRLLAGDTAIGEVNIDEAKSMELFKNGNWQRLNLNVDGSAYQEAQGQSLKIEIVNPDVGVKYDNILIDNLRLSKLTGAMATFASDDAVAGNGVTESQYTLQPVLTAAIA